MEEVNYATTSYKVVKRLNWNIFCLYLISGQKCTLLPIYILWDNQFKIKMYLTVIHLKNIKAIFTLFVVLWISIVDRCCLNVLNLEHYNLLLYKLLNLQMTFSYVPTYHKTLKGISESIFINYIKMGWFMLI